MIYARCVRAISGAKRMSLAYSFTCLIGLRVKTAPA